MIALKCKLLEVYNANKGWDASCVITSAVRTGPSPTWQSITKHNKALQFFQNITKFVYETNNTFVTWNTHINLKNIYGHKG